MWLLLVEDEPRLSRALRRGLEEEGYTVDAVADGDRAADLLEANEYDLAVVDWRLPGRDGRTIVRELRSAGRTVPVLMLTAMSDLPHRVAGLDAGADDYLTKPFAFEELLARLRAIARRSDRPEAGGALSSGTLSAGPLELDVTRRTVTAHGKPLDLRPKEFALLELFLRHPDRLITRTMIAERVWDGAYYVNDNLLDVTISRLRSRLQEADCDTYLRIRTIRGSGYRLDEETE